MPEGNHGRGKVKGFQDGQSHQPQRQGDCGAPEQERPVPALAGHPEKKLVGAQDEEIPLFDHIVNLAAQQPRRDPHARQDNPQVSRVTIPAEFALHRVHRP